MHEGSSRSRVTNIAAGSARDLFEVGLNEAACRGYYNKSGVFRNWNLSGGLIEPPRRSEPRCNTSMTTRLEASPSRIITCRLMPTARSERRVIPATPRARAPVLASLAFCCQKVAIVPDHTVAPIRSSSSSFSLTALSSADRHECRLLQDAQSFLST
jgi:hypothetical protein